MIARVVRVDVIRWRLGQTLVPVATILAIVARRIDNNAVTVAAFALLATALTVFVAARRSLGQRQLHVGHGRVQVGDGRTEIVAAKVNNWTFDRGVAHLYGTNESWKLSARAVDCVELQAALTRTFGKARSFKRRGSPGARRAALCVSIVGAVLLAVGIGVDLVPLAVVGVPCLIFGIAAFGALSQKVSTL
ncbi:MAG TPA: hypothetical protein VNO55_12605 [Polyangia bacterium]|nr:hypothetical protein [Polyangia bacterium]